MGDIWIMGDFWIMGEVGRHTDKQTNRQTGTHINTMTRPGLAGPSENYET